MPRASLCGIPLFFVPEVLWDQLLIRAQRNVLRHVEHFVIVAVLASQQHRAAFEQDCGIGIKQQTGNAIRSFRENDRSSIFFAEIEDLLYCMRLRRVRVRRDAAGGQIINHTHLDGSPKYSYVGLTAEKAGNEDLCTDTGQNAVDQKKSCCFHIILHLYKNFVMHLKSSFGEQYSVCNQKKDSAGFGITEITAWQTKPPCRQREQFSRFFSSASCSVSPHLSYAVILYFEGNDVNTMLDETSGERFFELFLLLGSDHGFHLFP